jgi:hypothetical protein
MSKNTNNKPNLELTSIEEKVMTTDVKEKKDLTELDLVKAEIESADTKEKKKKLRRAAIQNMGPLHLDQIYKKPGFRQRLVNVEPGNIAKRELEGYRPIKMQDAAYGNGTVDTAHGTGGVLEVEVGRRHSQKAVWMEIAEEDAQILDEIRDDLAKEQAGMIYKSDIPENARIGKVTKED